MLAILIQYFLLAVCQAATASPAWLTHSNIKCGSRTLVSTTTTSNNTFLSSFTTAFAGSSITCLSGVVDFQLNASNVRYFGVLVNGAPSGSSGCNFTLQLYDGTTLKSIKAGYFCYDTSIVTFLSSASTDQSYSWFDSLYYYTGDRSHKSSVTFSTGAIDLTHKVYIMPFLASWRLDKSSSTNSACYFTIKVTLQILDANTYNRVYAVTGNVSVSYIMSYRITYDQTAVQATQKTYLDAVFLTGTNTVPSSYSLVWSDPINYFAGVSHFNFSSSQVPRFSYNVTTFTLTSTGYVFLNISTINYRYRSCVSPTLYYMESSNLCYDVCPLGYFVNAADNYCQACYRGCLYCTSTAISACTSCDPTSNRTLNGTSCPCITSYYDNGTVQCQPCSASCLTCSGTSANCSTCPAGSHRTQSGTTCPCDAGYFQTGAAACASCNDLMPGCQTCTTTTVCTTCNTSMYMILNSSNLCACQTGNQRTLVSGTCQCNSGYADNGVALCVTCSSQMTGCLTCSSKTVCLTCNTGANWALTGSVCACASGYANSSGTCVTCSSVITGCLVCSTTSTCTTCNTTLNRALSAGACPCATGYVVSGSVCVTCVSLMTACTACSSASVCTTCDASLFRIASAGSCVCMSGYVLSGGVCVTCSSLMVGCTACSSTSVCTACNSSLYRTLSSDSCICSSGYILNNSLCTSCSSFLNGCLTCSSTSTCLSCDTANHFNLSGSSCICSTGYMNNSGVCDTCAGIMYGCLACTSATVCTGCDSDLYTTLTGTNCSCYYGYVYKNGTCVPCSDVIPGCSTCTDVDTCTYCGWDGYTIQGTTCVTCGSVIPGCINCSTTTECVACNTTELFSLWDWNCICDPGYVLSGYSCLTCSAAMPNCLTCSSGTACTTCATSYFVNSTSLCSLCSSVMPGCQLCNSSTTCTQCDSANKFSLSGTTCVCDAGYVLNGSGCATCNNLIAYCSMCTSATTCTQCDTGFYVSQTGDGCILCGVYMFGCLLCPNGSACTQCDVGGMFQLVGTTCVCKPGYALNTSICATCSDLLYECKSCTSSTECTSCSPGFFVNTTISSCETCSSAMPGCLTCSSGTVCTSCDSASNFQLSSSVCTCTPSYAISNGTCAVCSTVLANCLTCASNTSCSSCSPNYLINTTTSLCQVCAAFLPGCLTCSDYTTCSSCNSSLQMHLSGTTCECDTGFVFVAANGSCDTCSNAMANCTACTTGSVCTSCSAGSYVNPTTNQCSTCGSAIPGCSGCSSGTVCTACDAGLMMHLNGTKCSCDTGYALITLTKICETCGSVINACVDCSSETVCILCDVGYVLSPQGHCDSCYSFMPGCILCSSNSTCTECEPSQPFTLVAGKCVCPDGQYTNITGQNCANCSDSMPNCTACSSESYCTSCSAPFTALSGICRCPQSTQYFNTSTLLCQDCLQYCGTCTNSTACESCLASDNRQLDNTSLCACKLNFYPTNTTKCMVTGTCVTGYKFETDKCVEICGDGLVFESQCDDGNTDSGDGCNALCKIEVNFTCKDGSTTTASKCSYNKPIDMQLAAHKKDIYANAVTFTINVHPALKVLEKFNFSSIVNSSLPSQSIEANYKDGVVTVRVVYNQSIQSVSASISLNPPTGMDNTFDMKASSTVFTVDPENTEAYYFTQEAYQATSASSILIKICVGIGISVLIIGMGFWKIIGVETMNILQFLFYSMTFFTFLQPLLAPITQMYNSVNGYNDFFIDNSALNTGFNSPTMPKILTQMNVRPRFLQNYNYMFICQVFLLIAGGFLFMMGSILKDQKVYFMGFAKYVFNQIQLVLVMFNAMNVGVSLGIHCLYFSNPTQQPAGMQAANLTIASLTIVIAFVCFYFIIQHNDFYDHNNRVFKKSIYARVHPIILTAYRFCAGVLIGAGSEWRYTGWVVLGLQGLYLAYVCVKRPYKKTLISARAIVNQSLVCVIIILPMVYEFYNSGGLIGETEKGTFMNIPFWIELGLVAAAILLNTACMVFSVYKTLCKKKTAQVHPPLEEEVEESVKLNSASPERPASKSSKQASQPLAVLDLEEQAPEIEGTNLEESSAEINLGGSNLNRTKKRRIKKRPNVINVNNSPDNTKPEIEEIDLIPADSTRHNPEDSLIYQP